MSDSGRPQTSPGGGISTRAVHAPVVEPAQRSIVTPIHQTTTFALDEQVYEAVRSGVVRDEVFLYSRYGNPTLRPLELKLAALEGTEDALVTASGMAAISSTLFTLLRPGATVIAPRQLYGQTWEVLARPLTAWGVYVHFADFEDLGALEAALADAADPGPPALVYLESLSNPLLNVPPMRQVLSLSRHYGSTTVVDNTFLGPARLRPAELGADVVIESATKYLGGHSDVTAGVIATSKSRLDTIWRTNVLFGASLDPHAAFLLDRGVKTLVVRCRAQDENAVAVAGWLESRPEVAWVRHPALASHPQHERASDLWGGQSAMVSFRLHGGDDAALRLLGRVQRIMAATSLGGVESLISLPFNTSHPLPAQQQALGLEPGTVRLSVGIEDVADLIADLEQALR